MKKIKIQKKMKKIKTKKKRKLNFSPPFWVQKYILNYSN